MRSGSPEVGEKRKLFAISRVCEDGILQWLHVAGFGSQQWTLHFGSPCLSDQEETVRNIAKHVGGDVVEFTLVREERREE